MTSIDLKKCCGLAISYDGEKLNTHEQGVSMGPQQITYIDDIREQLLNQDLSCPNIFYRVFPNADWKSILKRRNLRYDIIVIPSNLAGIEYVKTKGMSVGNYPSLIDVAHGYVVLILQKVAPDKQGFDLTTTSIVRLKKGDKFVIPSGWDFSITNSRQVLGICSIIYSTKTRIETKFDETRGAAHYVIRKNARQEIVQNPSYRSVTTLNAKTPEEIYKSINLTAKTPIFKQILRKYERFKWLHEHDKLNWKKLLFTSSVAI